MGTDVEKRAHLGFDLAPGELCNPLSGSAGDQAPAMVSFTNFRLLESKMGYMRRSTFAFAAAVAAICLAAPAHAEKTLRAGEYDVRAVNQAGDAIAIKSVDGDQVLRLSSPKERSDRQMNAKLVFHRYGNTYFLSQIWMAGESTGRELPKTRQERAIDRELKTIASNKPAYEVVEVIAMAR